MPSHVSGGRFVVRHWHHPAIVAELHELSPHTRLWDLIVRAGVVFASVVRDTTTGGPDTWVAKDEWRGTANDLEILLKKHADSRLSDAEKREIVTGTWLGRRLGLCEKHFGPEVCRLERTRTTRTWILRARPQDKGGQP